MLSGPGNMSKTKPLKSHLLSVIPVGKVYVPHFARRENSSPMLAEFFATPKHIKHWPMISMCSIWTAKKCSWQTAWAGNTSSKPVNNLTIQEGWPEDKSQFAPLVTPDVSTLVVTDGLVFRGKRLVSPRRMRSQIKKDSYAGYQGIETCGNSRRLVKNLWRAQEHVSWLSAQLQRCERVDTIMWSLPRSRADTAQGNLHEPWSSRTSLGEFRLQSVLIP